MGDFGQRFDIADVSRGISTLSQNTALVFSSIAFSTEPRVVGFGESDVDSEAGQEMCEQRVGGAVQLRNRYDIRSRPLRFSTA